MNMYTNTKKSKKFILVLVLMMIFSFCCPKSANADVGTDIIVAPAKIFWFLEAGLSEILFSLFVDLEILEIFLKLIPKFFPTGE